MTGQESHKLAAKAREASDLLKALAHQSRILILCILAKEERTVGEIENILGIQQAMVSQQLARLRLEGLVNTRREGRLVYYSIGNTSVLTFLESLFDLFPVVENS